MGTKSHFYTNGFLLDKSINNLSVQFELRTNIVQKKFQCFRINFLNKC